MSLPGPLLEKIRDALMSAFPDRDEFIQMLRFGLEIHDSTLPNGSNNKTFAFKVVEKCLSEGRIIELIQKAHKANPGNPELKNLYNDISEIILIEILFPSQEQERKTYQEYMKRVYSRYFAVDSLKVKDWELKNIQDILDNLKQIRTDKNIVINFVDYLLSDKKLPSKTLEELEKWRHEASPDLPIQNKYLIIKKQTKEILTHLLILVKPSQQQYRQNKKLYSVQAWFACHDSNTLSEPLPDNAYRSLEIKSQDRNTFFWEEIPDLVGDFLFQIGSFDIDDTASSTIPTIEFFLPRQLLCEPIDKLEPRYKADGEKEQYPNPIGRSHRVILRSHNRLKQKQYKNFWLNKWKRLQQKEEDYCNNCFAWDNYDTCDKMYHDLNKENGFLALRLFQSPCEKILRTLEVTGTPIALWVRNEFKNDTVKTEFDDIIRKSPIKELPEQIKNQRSKALSKEKNDHIGHHISLLWENPYIVPPEISYTIPS